MVVITILFANTAATGLFCEGGKIKGRLLKFCQSHTTSLSGMAICDLAKFKQPAVTFSLLIKTVGPAVQFIIIISVFCRKYIIG